MNVVDWYIAYGTDHRKMAEKLLRFLNMWSIWRGCWSIDVEHSNDQATILIAQHQEEQRDIVPVTKDVINLVVKEHENQKPKVV